MRFFKEPAALRATSSLVLAGGVDLVLECSDNIELVEVKAKVAERC